MDFKCGWLNICWVSNFVVFVGSSFNGFQRRRNRNILYVWWNKECMCRLPNIESVTDGQTDDGQSDPYVSLCFAGDTKNVDVTYFEPYKWVFYFQSMKICTQENKAIHSRKKQKNTVPWYTWTNLAATFEVLSSPALSNPSFWQGPWLVYKKIVLSIYKRNIQIRGVFNIFLSPDGFPHILSIPAICFTLAQLIAQLYNCWNYTLYGNLCLSGDLETMGQGDNTSL